MLLLKKNVGACRKFKIKSTKRSLDRLRTIVFFYVKKLDLSRDTVPLSQMEYSGGPTVELTIYRFSLLFALFLLLLAVIGNPATLSMISLFTAGKLEQIISPKINFKF
jgi:hypothetical protein